jgi:hypothetical protein
MDELPQYFWLHITSTVVLAVLALAATAALLRWTLDEVEDGGDGIARAATSDATPGPTDKVQEASTGASTKSNHSSGLMFRRRRCRVRRR